MTDFTPDRARIFSDLAALVSFNSPHSTPELADAHEAACAWTAAALEKAGLEVTRYPTVDDADTTGSLTASARVFRPDSRLRRASSSNAMVFAM